jgi:transcriptional regulator with XRE-family HTH domain
MKPTPDKKALLILLIEKGITQSEIARQLGVGRSHVINVLAGRRTSARVIDCAARLLGVSADDLRENYIPRRAA